MALNFLERYPDCRSMLWLLANLYERSGEVDSALKVYTRLDTMVQRIPGGSPYNQATLMFKKCSLLLKKGANLECVNLCKSVKHYKKYESEDKRIKKILKDIKKVCKKAKKELANEKK
jgi:hypothetical protein